MRQQIEALIQQYDEVVRERQGIDRVAEPRVWAEVDLDCSAAAGRLGGEVREAARKLGLTRDLSRALAGTADPAVAERVRAFTEDFFSRTGVEVTFPYDRLAA